VTAPADPSTGYSVRPVASSALANAAPTPTIAGGATVAAANSDSLSASQARRTLRHPRPVPS